MVADEDVDTETLQAQIDMSMSFVHNLVTSWIHPVHAAQLRTAATHAERTLDEELRRPARLGVGAPIPGIPPAARDAAKLKHRLSKASEKRPTSDQPLSQPHSTSDEEEKGRATKRKIRGDPFAMEKSKKKRKISEVLQIGPTPGTSQHRALDRTVAIKHEVSSGVGSWKHPKQETWAKRGKKLGIDLESRTLSGTKSHQLPVTSPLAVNPPFHLTSPAAHVPLRSGEASDSALRSTGSGAPPNTAIPPAVLQPTHSPFPVFEHPGSQVMRNGLSLLNLDGPPGSLDELGNANNPSNSRKKRRKRKKKRAPSGPGTGGN